MMIWPYRILKQDDEDIKSDLNNIMHHFKKLDHNFDMVVFVPQAGIYLEKLFSEMYTSTIRTEFVTVQRVSTLSNSNVIKDYIFKKKFLADFFRHIEVFLRLIKFYLRLNHKRAVQEIIEFDVFGKEVLVIDDSIDTGNTMDIIKKLLCDNGAKKVTTACITNHLVPKRVSVDYSVYTYRLLRTKNSRDYYAS